MNSQEPISLDKALKHRADAREVTMPEEPSWTKSLAAYHVAGFLREYLVERLRDVAVEDALAHLVGRINQSAMGNVDWQCDLALDAVAKMTREIEESLRVLAIRMRKYQDPKFRR